MTKFVAFADLRSVHDLLLKLEHDFNRMHADFNDVYAAFDFFVTAEHMVDWEAQGMAGGMTQMRRGDPLLRIVSHIANGAKHFAARPEQHKSVSGVAVAHLIEPGYVKPGYCEEPVRILLSAEEAKHFGTTSIFAKELAKMVLQFWQDRLTLGRELPASE